MCSFWHPAAFPGLFIASLELSGDLPRSIEPPAIGRAWPGPDTTNGHRGCRYERRGLVDMMHMKTSTSPENYNVFWLGIV